MSRQYISVEVDRNIRNIAKNRCGYCLSPQKLVMARLHWSNLELLEVRTMHSYYFAFKT